MFSTLSKRFIYSFSIFSLVLTSGLTRADDTEIYFTGGGLDEAARPNVLFILDTSGSMTSTVSGTGGQQRVDVMKEAVKEVIEDVQDINVGLMRFTSGSGGPVLFPIKYVEENTFNVVGEPTADLSYTATITDGLNDVEMNLDSTPADLMYLNDATIEMDQINPGVGTVPTSATFQRRIDAGFRDAEEKVGGSNNGDVDDDSGDLDFRPNSLVGLRFNQVTVPQNAKITNAYINFRRDNYKSATTNIDIYGVDNDDPASFTECNNSCDDISGRTKTTAKVDWNGVTTGNYPVTPDLTSIVQEIISRNCADPNDPANLTGCTYGLDDMMFVFETTTGNRDWESYNGTSNASRRPLLTIEYDSTVTVATPGDTQISGLRFDNIRIPQGATITDAKLVFTPVDTNTTATTWTITAEDADNSEPFSVTAGDINTTNRTRTTASVNWAIGTSDWAAGVSVESADIKTVLQEVVNRTNWCGGNSVSFFVAGADTLAQVRGFESYEGSSADAVRLEYTYTPGSGCFSATETAQTSIGTDDAEQFGSSVDTIDTDLDLGFDSETSSNQTVAVRFQGVDVPQGATITSATLDFFAQGTSTGTASFTIKGIDEDDVATFAASTDDISSRSTTSAAVTWAVEDWTTSGERYATDDISTIVQEIVGRGGWSSGNNMAFVVETGTGSRIADSYNSDPARGPRLTITYEDSVNIPFKSVRETLVEIIDDLPASGATPIQETLYEAARYWRGESMEFGDSRAGSRTSRISHPGSYCTSENNCRGAKENDGGTTPTDGFGVYTPSGCNVSVNPNDSDCASQVIEHDDNSAEARYISPFSSDLTCANNYQVLLTDGSANSGNDNYGAIRSLIGGVGSCYANNSTFKETGDAAKTYTSSEDCSVDLAEYLATNDQSTATVGENLANDQIVKTYTIGFNLDNVSTTQFIKDMANLGEGGFYEANTAGQLVDVFTTILTDVKSDPTSFVSPSLATNAFNRLLSRDEVYFGLFTPALSASWYGNMKKYNICVDSAEGCDIGEILDANGDEAIDGTDSKFKDTAQSIWSGAIDGRATTSGGAGAEITDHTAQIVYTDKISTGQAPTNTALDTAGYKLTSTTWDDTELGTMRSSICPTPSTTGGSECEDRMLWLLGKKIVTDADNDVSANQRWSVNDVLHSSPSVITYGGADDGSNGGTAGDGEIDVFYDKVLYGTNDGMLHFVNGTTGAEEWRYIPSDFWAQQQTQYLNAQGDHTYGLDVTPTIWAVDNDGDGNIEPASGDTVKAFVATRRGGNYIYALDLTATVTTTTTQVVPKFIWKIQGGSGDYARLGQTWSKPELTTISISDGGGGLTTKDVLIFGGGYDTSLDDPNVYDPADNSNNDFLGNAIFITDPTNGTVIVSISGASSGADIEVSDMSFSIPSRIRTIDTDGDGDTDRLYVGDTGGQVWRVDLDPFIDPASTSPEADTIVGKLADVSGATAVTERRFYEPPAVVQVRDETFSSTSEYDYVLIGTGYRAHPLNSDTQDRFYAFRDRVIQSFVEDNDADTVPDYDADGDNVAESADGYPVGGGTAFTGSTLVDVTSVPLDATDSATQNGDGWYYDFTSAGTAAEKVLSAPTVTAGAVVFTTFKPSTASVTDPCVGGVGDAAAYNFNILSANAALDWDGDGDIDLDDRKLGLGGGIPSDVVPVFTKEGVVGIVGIEGGASQLGVLSGLPRFRTYWYEES